MSQDRPAAPLLAARLLPRLPFFYGWIIVAIAFLSVFMMGATSFWAMPVFVNAMHDDTGWSHASIFAGLTLHFILGATGGLAVGRFADRPGGAARLLLIGTLLNGAALVSLRWVESPLEFVLLYGLVGGAGGTGIRLVQNTLVAKWFVVGRGKAVGLSTNGGSFSALIMIPLIALLIDQLGWRDAWTALGVILLVILLPMVPFAVRSPEDLGLLPDSGAPASPRGRASGDERSYQLSELVRSGQFWLLLLAVLIGSYSLQAHTVVMVPHFEEIGFSSATAASALSLYGVTSVITRLAWGLLADRRGARFALVIQAALTGLGAVVLLGVTDHLTLYLAIAFQGMVLSGFPTLQILIWPEFFGRLHIGSIVGLTWFFSSIAGSVGPSIAGFTFDRTGAYETALWMLLATWLACSLLMLTVGPAPAARRAGAPVGEAGTGSSGLPRGG